MFGEFKKDESTNLDAIIARVLLEMEMYGPEAEEFPKLISYLERLETIKVGNRRARLSPDTMAVVAGNLFGIVIIIAYEQKHVMVSKALALILKTK
jgi:hypothetical protein